MWAESTSGSGGPGDGSGNDIVVNGTTSTTGGINNPSSFTATTASTAQINLTWGLNGNSDNVMVAYSTNGTFGTPTDGSAYSISDVISGGGTVIYNGSATSYNHPSLSSNTHYYYKAWSVDGSNNYSSGVTADATTYKPEPSNQVASFAVGSVTPISIPLTWSDNDGAVAADGYLIMINTTGTFTAPVDGTAQTDDTDVRDGSGQINIGHGSGSYTFSHLYPGTNYYFKIWPYTNSGSGIDYKTDGTVATANATTPSANTSLIISVVADPSDDYNARFVEIYNLSSQTIDFDTYDWYLVKQVNGGTMYSYKLSGSILPSGTFVYGNSSNFSGAFGFDADIQDGNISGSGDDGYFLYFGGDATTGAIIDSYGVIDQDGTGYPWEYTDSKAIRATSVSAPNPTWTASEWTIASAAVADFTPGTYRDCITWNGASSTDMTATGNWVGSTVPTSTKVVKIPAGVTNNPVVNTAPASATTYAGLCINSSASLTVNPGKALTVSGDLVNYGTLTLASDATGNGSLIVGGSPTGNVTVQRYVAAYTSSSDGWHLMGAAFDADPSGTSFDPSGTNNDLFSWDEVTNMWTNYKANAFTFHRGYGALMAQESTTTNSINGTLSNSNFTASDLSYTSGQGDGLHLMGNPFTSAIKWNDGNWTLTNIGTHAEIYNESAGNYTVLNANDIIPSNNGFFVQVSSGTNTLTIPAAACTHDATGNYKTTATSDGISMKVTGEANSYYDITQIQFLENATDQWDINLDAHKISGAATAPQLWTVSNNEEYALNCLPIPTENRTIPVGFKAGVNSTYHLSWTGMNNMDSNLEFLLEDKLAGTTINMRDADNYDFEASTDDNSERFTLHINGANGIPQASEDNALVYALGSDVYIKAKNSQSLEGRVTFNNILGQVVYHTELNGTTQQMIRTQLKSGVYIIRMEMKNGQVSSQKIVIK
ncbi:MAG: T9SS type A sorting domain-containing protein [Bacteroidales bacterium]|nr:T9SS type A sorting domain-containing protein [Bacteroidales bacterium]